MKKKVLVFIVSLLILTGIVGLVMADTQQQATATVTVNTFVDITLVECPGSGTCKDGIDNNLACTVDADCDLVAIDDAAGTCLPTTFSYGGQDPGAEDVSMLCQDSDDGALELTVEATTNTPVTVDISGIDYDGPGAEDIAIEETVYDDDGTIAAATTFTETPTTTTVWTSMGGTAAGEASGELWFWLDVPDVFLTAGTYTSTYTVDASET